MKWMVLKALRQRAGIDVVRARKNPNTMDFIENRGINLVLDVGANIGQFGQSLRNRGYAGRIISFEPVKEAFTALENAARGDDLWTTSNLALGASSGVMAIHVSKNSQFSSFNDLTATATSFDPEAELQGVGKRRRQDFGRSRAAARPGFEDPSKIDTQGYERAVLEGAKETLKRVSGVLLSCPSSTFTRTIGARSGGLYDRGRLRSGSGPSGEHP